MELSPIKYMYISTYVHISTNHSHSFSLQATKHILGTKMDHAFLDERNTSFIETT